MRTQIRNVYRFAGLALVAAFSSAQSCGPSAAVPVAQHNASVDRDFYLAGAAGTTTFSNGAGPTAWLSGCSAFHFEQSVDGVWVDRGQPFECVWEGFAQPVPEGSVFESGFNAPTNSGLWRLNFAVGEGCDAGLPQSACDEIFPIVTNAFSVEREICAPTTFECRFAPAAPNFLCADGVSVGGPSGDCTLDPSTGVCGYEILACP
jgi:hypothetical protein